MLFLNITLPCTQELWLTLYNINSATIVNDNIKHYSVKAKGKGKGKGTTESELTPSAELIPVSKRFQHTGDNW